MNLISITNKFNEAVIQAEMANADYKIDRENRRIIARYLRALRKCDQLRRELKTALAKGTL